MSDIVDTRKGVRVSLGRMPGRGIIHLVVLWAIILTMPFWMTAVGGYTGLGTRVMVIGLAAMATNFAVGHTGVMSLGQAAYFGVGAYGVALILKFVAPSVAFGFVVGVVLGTIAGAVLGYLMVKLRGIYFALASIAFGQVFYYIAFRWQPVTGGDNGTSITVPPLHLGFMQVDLANSLVLFYVVAVLFAICTAIMAIILRSPFGHTLLAVRENENRARFLGINVNRHIWIAFTISCLFAAVAGVLYTLLNSFVGPSSLGWELSGDFVLMAIIGGMKSFWGPLFGAAFFVLLQNYLSSVTRDWMFFIGAVFVLVVLFLPRGFVGLASLWRRRRA